jgi:hypothetical protein
MRAVDSSAVQRSMSWQVALPPPPPPFLGRLLHSAYVQCGTCGCNPWARSALWRVPFLSTDATSTTSLTQKKPTLAFGHEHIALCAMILQHVRCNRSDEALLCCCSPPPPPPCDTCLIVVGARCNRSDGSLLCCWSFRAIP